MIKYKHSISVVIPVYNGAKTIKELISSLENVLGSFADYKIILVNDSSKDESIDIIEKLAGKNKKILVIDLEENYGQQRAIYIGLKHAVGDYTVIMDDDMTQDPTDITTLYNGVITGYDAVYGINMETKQKFIRKLGSKLRDHLFYSIGGLDKDLKVCSFRIIKKNIVDMIDRKSDFLYISMEILKHTKNISNVRIKYLKGGASNYSLYNLIKLYLNTYIYYADVWFVKYLRSSKKKFLIKKMINEDI